MTLATSNMEVVGTLDTNTTWYDIMVPRNADDRYTEMEEADWSEFKTELYVNAHGRAACMEAQAFAQRIDAVRAVKQQPKQATSLPNYWAEYRMWLDMVNEPEKYGEDIDCFMELDEHLTASNARWRLNAEWLRQEAAFEEAEECRKVLEAAIKIQAAFRGHLVRDTQVCLNCEHCLAHTVSPYTVSGEHVCAACYDEWVFG